MCATYAASTTARDDITSTSYRPRHPKPTVLPNQRRETRSPRCAASPQLTRIRGTSPDEARRLPVPRIRFGRADAFETCTEIEVAHPVGIRARRVILHARTA